MMGRHPRNGRNEAPVLTKHAWPDAAQERLSP